METANLDQLKTAGEIVNAGLMKAAESLSFFMKEKITLTDTDYSFDESKKTAVFTSKQGDNIHVLITEVIGELKGICCLIFSEEEADKLRHTALPPEIINNPAMMQEMSDGILLEVDNIISASVITQFSNILKHKIYGGVPSILKLNQSQLDNFIQDKLEQNLFIISFNTHFISSSLDFKPQFIWLFDTSFADSIKKHGAAPANSN